MSGASAGLNASEKRHIGAAPGPRRAAAVRGPLGQFIGHLRPITKGFRALSVADQLRGGSRRNSTLELHLATATLIQRTEGRATK
jgi:hypothetical protein